MRTPTAGRTIGVTLALLGASTAAGRAQDDLKAALPPHTLAYMSAPDFERWASSFKTTALYKIWVEEEVQEFFADLLTTAKTALADPTWRPFYVESYTAAALVYFAFCFFMSRYSQYLERVLQSGTRRG